VISVFTRGVKYVGIIIYYFCWSWKVLCTSNSKTITFADFPITIPTPKSLHSLFPTYPLRKDYMKPYTDGVVPSHIPSLAVFDECPNNLYTMDLDEFCSRYNSLFVVVEFGLIMCPGVLYEMQVDAEYKEPPEYFPFWLVVPTFTITRTSLTEAFKPFTNSTTLDFIFKYNIAILIVDWLLLLAIYVGNMFAWTCTLAAFVLVLFFIVKCVRFQQHISFSMIFKFSLYTLTIAIFWWGLFGSNFGISISGFWMICIILEYFSLTSPNHNYYSMPQQYHGHQQ